MSQHGHSRLRASSFLDIDTGLRFQATTSPFSEAWGSSLFPANVSTSQKRKVSPSEGLKARRRGSVPDGAITL